MESNLSSKFDSCKQVFYNFVNGFFMMRNIPIMWNVIKMSISVFATVATTFIIANLIQGFNHEFWVDVGEQIIIVNFTSWNVLYIGTMIAIVFLIYYVVRIAIIFKRSRQNKVSK